MSLRMTATLILAGLGAAAAGAQEVPWANKFFTEQSPPPAVVVHDFGNVPHGKLLTYSFPLRNIYDRPMQIGEVRKSCGCVNAKPSKRVLGSREVGTLDITMDARKFTGNKAVTVYATVESTTAPVYRSTAVLQVRAHARTDVTITPGLVQLGTVARGQTPTASVRIEYAGRREWQIVGRADSCDQFDVRVKPAASQRGRSGFDVFVTLKADADAGVLSEDLILKTNDPANPQVQVKVVGNVIAPLSARPSRVRFGATPAGDTVTKMVMIEGKRPFRIVRIDGTGNGLEAVPNANRPATIQIVKVTYSPSDNQQAVERKLTFVTDLGGLKTAVMVTAAAK